MHNLKHLNKHMNLLRCYFKNTEQLFAKDTDILKRVCNLKHLNKHMNLLRCYFKNVDMNYEIRIPGFAPLSGDKR